MEAQMARKVWLITKHNSTEEVGSWRVPGHYSQTEVEAIMQRMVCTDLTPAEVLNASRRKNDTWRSSHLDRIGNDPCPQYGDNPWYIAELTDE